MGDDNIEGYASIPQLHDLCVADPVLYKDYCRVHDENKVTWRTNPLVQVSYEHNRGEPVLQGAWTVKGGWGASGFMFGPEVPIGNALQKHTNNEPILIVKAGWSGRSLAKDFTAPDDNGGGGGGFQWYRVLQDWKQLRRANMATVMGNASYKRYKPVIAGIIWWQGYADLNNKKEYSAREYSRLLQHWITSIRSHLGMFVPIVVAELGGEGTLQVSARELEFRQMQRAVVESISHTRLVPTAVHNNNTTCPFYDDAPLQFNQQHYFRRADTMIAIGEDLATALLELRSLTGGRKRGGGSLEAWMILLVGIGLTLCLCYRNVTGTRKARRRRRRQRMADEEEDDDMNSMQMHRFRDREEDESSLQPHNDDSNSLDES